MDYAFFKSGITLVFFMTVRPASEASSDNDKEEWYAHIPPPHPHLSVDDHIPRNLKRLKPLSRMPRPIMQVSDIRGHCHRVSGTPSNSTTSPVSESSTHAYYYLYAIQHLDTLTQVIIQPIAENRFQIIDTAYRLLYTINTEFEGICCGREGPEVEFRAMNTHRQHIITITRHNGQSCPVNRSGNIEVKLEPDVPIGTVEAEDNNDSTVKNISGDVLCHIKVENPKSCCHTPVYQVIPARRGEDLGRIENHHGGLLLTFPWRSETTTRAILMSACVLMLYDAERAKQSKVVSTSRSCVMARLKVHVCVLLIFGIGSLMAVPTRNFHQTPSSLLHSAPSPLGYAPSARLPLNRPLPLQRPRILGSIHRDMYRGLLDIEVTKGNTQGHIPTPLLGADLVPTGKTKHHKMNGHHHHISPVLKLEAKVSGDQHHKKPFSHGKPALLSRKTRYINNGLYFPQGFGKAISPYFGSARGYGVPYVHLYNSGGQYGLQPTGKSYTKDAIPEPEPVAEPEYAPGDTPSLTYGVPHPSPESALGPYINILKPHNGLPKRVHVNSLSSDPALDPIQDQSDEYDPLHENDLPDQFTTRPKFSISKTLYRHEAEKLTPVSINIRRKG
ncbi:hypothetical protein SK128_003954 [Halocaridina rubra]|uniref:Uncharacterized protein n=1 Tax=Halocaridina rubra TaxID=373956 RepID=A0AAN8X3C6_HALRR